MPYAKIKTTQATLTLEQLHAELAGKILDNKAEAKHLVQSMKHVEAVIKLLDPAFNLKRIAVRRRKPNPWFKRGTLFRSAIGVLRTAEKPLSAKEIGDRLLAMKGVTGLSRKAAWDFTGGVQSGLRKNNGKTVTQISGRPERWKLNAVE